jgi:release factor glutamine methyltransferase
MLWREHYRQFSNTLQAIYDESEANSIARLVFEHTGNDHLQNLENQTPADQQTAQLNKYLTQLLTHRPVQYVLHEAWFYNLRFEVNESVLIPRPETEELAERIIQEIKSKIQIPNSRVQILDIGTGSGCIPICIKKNIPAAEVTAIDVCSEALHVAMNNAVIHETDIIFQLLDFLDGNKWNELGEFDVIISNPPYIKSSESKTMSEHVLLYEPHKALFVPDDDALLFYKKIADFALQHLKSCGAVYVEINQQLGKETVNVFAERGFNKVELRKDMSGNERFVKAGMVDG